MNSAAEMLEAAGLKNVAPFDDGSAPGLCIHEMGTARMGRDPEDVRAQRLEPGAHGAERLRHRWRVHDVELVRQSVADLHGPDGARLRSGRQRNQEAEPVRPAMVPSTEPTPLPRHQPPRSHPSRGAAGRRGAVRRPGSTSSTARGRAAQAQELSAPAQRRSPARSPTGSCRAPTRLARWTSACPRSSTCSMASS